MPQEIGSIATNTNSVPAALRRVAEKLLATKTDRSGGPDACWPWMAARRRAGHGQAWFNQKNWLPHRLAFILKNGPITKDLCVLHRCDNPPCCNPAHLFLGDRNDNLQDMVAKGRYNVNGKRNWHRGTTHKNAKLTDDAVREIRALHAAKKATQEQLAAQFGVGQTTISNILIGKIWRHVV